MPIVTIQLNKGAFANVDDVELSDPSFAIKQQNALNTDAGGLIDSPGLSDFSSIGTFPCDGLTYFKGFLVAVSSSRRTYKVTEAGVATEITGPTTLEGSSRPVFATDGDYLSISGGGHPQRWSGTGNLAEMPGSPVDSTHMVYLDGYWIAPLIDDQELRWAGPSSVLRETWSSANFFSAEGRPDNIVALTESLRELYAFGEGSLEVFQNFGDSSVPFRRTFFIDKGTRSPHSIIKANNTHYYLNTERQFVRLDGRTPTVISTPYDRRIQDLTTVTDCIGNHIAIRGHYLCVWTFPTEELTVVYDYKADSWSEWSTWDGSSDKRFRMNSHVFIPEWKKHIAGDFRSGALYELTFQAKTHGDFPRRIIRRSGYIDHGTGNLKRSNEYRLHLKRGLGASGGTVPQLLMRFRDDDKGWSDYESIDLGLIGDFEPIFEIRNTGIYRKRQIEFLQTDAVEFCLSKLEEDVEVMRV